MLKIEDEQIFNVSNEGGQGPRRASSFLLWRREFRPRGSLLVFAEVVGSAQAAFEGMTFSVSEERPDGSVAQVALRPGGDSQLLTFQNRGEFVDLYAQYLLVSSVAEQVKDPRVVFKSPAERRCCGSPGRGEERPLSMASDFPVSVSILWVRSSRGSRRAFTWCLRS